MASSYATRGLFGGAMRVQLPVELIDSSDLRQVPDHQEVFLSPTTLTSIIFEINDYVEQSDLPSSQHPTTTTTTTTRPDGTTTTTTTTVVNGNAARETAESDAEAAQHHFTDVISPPDTLAAPLPRPQQVRLQSPSLAAYPAYILAANIRSYDTAHRAPQTASSPNPLQSLVHQIQLLVRIQDYATDLCVRINVPLKELADHSQAAAEAAFARDVLARVVATLDVVEFDLFGAQ
ncbi:hypothetical protein A1O3_05803 [Capronia epimyces CBS 606.96]|uniref:Uncharacterized protein n=1 Tax=Capronia epimyces CBS 606.96 TaxID=1182542 RepID=W9XY04_9EURO|nr:uncharacterized protein A1O3_05803 [Capronia epimyces CBS 606.96]EXJ85128.1 hypothetical protein A1O3_05803 [Capronia epimyces CBS 606.96]